jgi:lipoprotein NlpD
LYSIAWRHGLSYRELARWNGLADADLIFAGQRLRLSAPSAASTVARTTPASSQRSTRSKPAPLPAVPLAPEPTWVWPARGPLLRAFGDPAGLGDGVDISGRRGDPVRAAAGGSVVYTGSGLMGYGQLIIIKHNDSYLTAYGHNDSLLVAEGDQVATGQSIATMGVGNDGKAIVHFELRRNGDPLDPVQHLPRR